MSAAPGGRPRASLVAVLLALTVVVLAAWAARAEVGRRAIRDSDAAAARGDVQDAVLAARNAAQARCPLCAAPEQGFQRLEAIATQADKRADDTTALLAWRAVRAASLATATMSARSERRDRAEAEIARIGHRIDAAAAKESGNPTAAATEARLKTALAEDDLPGGLAYALAALGGGAFLLGAIRYARGRSLADLALVGVGVAVTAVGLVLF